MYSVDWFVLFCLFEFRCHEIVSFLKKTDLAKEQGQDERIIPFEEHHRLSTKPMLDIMGTSSTKSVIDIRELQFEHCLYSNHRKEVSIYQI